MEKQEIKNKVFKILSDKLKINFSASELPQYSLLDPKIGLLPRDLLVLFFELQKEFQISFEEKDIIEKRFDYMDIMIDIIAEKLEEVT